MAKRRSFFKSLRGKVSLQMLIVSLVPILIAGGLVYNSMAGAEQSASNSVDESRNTLQQETVGANKAGLAWLLSYDMEKWLAERIDNVSSWARNEVVLNATRDVTDSDNSTRKFLGGEIADVPDFEDVYVTGLSGELVTQVGYDQPDLKSDEASWRLGKENGLYVSEVSLPEGGISRSYNLDIAVLVEDLTTGASLGVLVGVIEVHPLTLGQEYESKVWGNRIMVWNRVGKIIADTGNNERYLKETPNWTDAERQVTGKITDDALIIEPDYAITDDVVAGYARATNESVNRQIDGFDGLGWTVMVEQDADTAFAALDSLEELGKDLENNTSSTMITLVIIIIVVIIVVPGLAYYLSRGITNPIVQLNDAAEKISTGDMDVNVNVKSDDEIGDLAQSFGRMVASMKFMMEDAEPAPADDFSQKIEAALD